MSFKELLTLIGVIPTFLFLATVFPQIWPLFVVGWLFCLGFDVYSTYGFYIEDPSQFQNKERNKFFVWFTRRFGFKKAVLFFSLGVEVPVVLFFAGLPLQFLHSYMFFDVSDRLIVCVLASLGMCAVGHLQAGFKNTNFCRSIKGCQGCVKTTQRLCRFAQTLAPLNHVRPNLTQSFGYNPLAINRVFLLNKASLY